MKRKLRVAVAGHSPPAEPQDVRYSAPDDEPIKRRQGEGSPTLPGPKEMLRTKIQVLKLTRTPDSATAPSGGQNSGNNQRLKMPAGPRGFQEDSATNIPNPMNIVSAGNGLHCNRPETAQARGNTPLFCNEIPHGFLSLRDQFPSHLKGLKGLALPKHVFEAIAFNLLEAVEALQKNGVSHRGLSLDTVLVGPGLSVKIRAPTSAPNKFERSMINKSEVSRENDAMNANKFGKSMANKSEVLHESGTVNATNIMPKGSSALSKSDMSDERGTTNTSNTTINEQSKTNSKNNIAVLGGGTTTTNNNKSTLMGEGNTTNATRFGATPAADAGTIAAEHGLANGIKEDMLSIGFLVFMCVTGHAPPNLQGLQGRPELNDVQDCKARDLLRWLMHSNTNKRPQASKALRHPWLRDYPSRIAQSAAAQSVSSDQNLYSPRQGREQHEILPGNPYGRLCQSMPGWASSCLYRGANQAVISDSDHYSHHRIESSDRSPPIARHASGADGGNASGMPPTPPPLSIWHEQSSGSSGGAAGGDEHSSLSAEDSTSSFSSSTRVGGTPVDEAQAGLSQRYHDLNANAWLPSSCCASSAESSFSSSTGSPLPLSLRKYAYKSRARGACGASGVVGASKTVPPPPTPSFQKLEVECATVMEDAPGLPWISSAGEGKGGGRGGGEREGGGEAKGEGEGGKEDGGGGGGGGGGGKGRRGGRGIRGTEREGRKEEEEEERGWGVGTGGKGGRGRRREGEGGGRRARKGFVVVVPTHQIVGLRVYQGAEMPLWLGSRLARYYRR
eukprot:jgi/Undpi1/5604/HiC_scaffold_2.g00880.m1